MQHACLDVCAEVYQVSSNGARCSSCCQLLRSSCAASGNCMGRRPWGGTGSTKKLLVAPCMRTLP
eukprot:4167040-Amphidinium_carterae.1